MVVFFDKIRCAAPRAPFGVCVGPVMKTDELDAVVDSAIRVALSYEISVSSPRIVDDLSAWFDPVTC
jgi:hypothetical protein